MEVDRIESRIKTLTLDSASKSLILPNANSEYYYTLLDAADESNREQLQQERLRHVLEQLQREREDTTFSRDCLFCRSHFTGNRSVLLDHLMEQHNFVFGNPDNIVFIHELLDHLEWMLKTRRCFWCEGTFKDWMTLKEHMRKKQHKRINPDNKNYDRFYIVNYLEIGKNWKDVEQEEEFSQEDSEMETADTAEEAYVCLFCENRFLDLDVLWTHAKDNHKFDFIFLKEYHHLSFYDQIKLINYIRKKIHEKECIICDSKFAFREELSRHLLDTGHTSMLPDRAQWDQPLYFFSTFENDNLLCSLEVEDSDCQDCVVYPEEHQDPIQLPIHTQPLL